MIYLSKGLCVGIMLLLTASARSYAQLPDFNVQLLDDHNGIQTANALRLIRDRTGFLWVLSPRHIQRFDGQSVKRIDTEGEDLLDLASDSTGTIWAVSNTEIRSYHNERHAFAKARTVGPGFGPLNKLGKLQVTPDDQVWANAGRGLYRYDTRTHAFRFGELPGLPHHYYYRKIFGRLGYQLYLADMRAIYAFETKKNAVRRIPFANILAIAPVNAHIAWVSNQSLETFEINFSNGSVRRIPARSKAHPDGIPLAELISFTSLGGDRNLVNTTKGCYI